jgi:hypothetical protein
MTHPLKIVPSKTDVEAAAEIKDRFIQSAQPLIACIEDAKNLGFDVHFHLEPGPLGNIAITVLKVTKEF